MYSLGQQLTMKSLYNKKRNALTIPTRVEKLEDTWYMYQKKIGPYWVLCTKFDWPTVWLPKSMEVDPSEYYIEIEGEQYRFGWDLNHQFMRNLHTVQDLAPKPQDIRNNEVPEELKTKPVEPVKVETPEDFYKLEDEVETAGVRSFAFLIKQAAYSDSERYAWLKAHPSDKVSVFQGKFRLSSEDDSILVDWVNSYDEMIDSAIDSVK